LRTRSLLALALPLTLACTVAAFAAAQMQLPPQPKVHPAGIPKTAVLLSPCIRTMGEHWATPSDLPNGPIYGVWQGKPIFTEIMVSVKQLDRGFSWANIRPLPGYRIDHLDFEFEPHGHAGYPVPHYDVHLYYISYAAQMKICPTGLPDPAMKPTRTGV
jgi:hypothetical protein